jgi:hypothetical protein
MTDKTKRTFKDSMAAYNAGHLLDLVRDFTADDCYAHGGWLKPVGWWIDDHTGQRKIGDIYNETFLEWHFFAFHSLDLRLAKLDPSENIQPGDESTAPEPEAPHFGRYANYFERYAEQIGRATSKAVGKIRRRKLR